MASPFSGGGEGRPTDEERPPTVEDGLRGDMCSLLLHHPKHIVYV